MRKAAFASMIGKCGDDVQAEVAALWPQVTTETLPNSQRHRRLPRGISEAVRLRDGGDRLRRRVESRPAAPERSGTVIPDHNHRLHLIRDGRQDYEVGSAASGWAWGGVGSGRGKCLSGWTRFPGSGHTRSWIRGARVPRRVVGGGHHLHLCVEIIHVVKRPRLGRLRHDRAAELQLAVMARDQMKQVQPHIFARRLQRHPGRPLRACWSLRQRLLASSMPMVM